MAKSHRTRTSAAQKGRLKSLLNTAVTDANSAIRGIHVITKVLSEMMQEVHGGEWKFTVNHEQQFITITPDLAKEDACLRTVKRRMV